MNWDAIGAIGELLGAVLFMGSLIFLGFQVREARKQLEQNANGQQAATIQATHDAFNTLNAILMQNFDLAQIFYKGYEDPDSLNDEELQKFSWIWRCYMNLYNNLYMQEKLDVVPEALWLQQASELKPYIHKPMMVRMQTIDATYNELLEYVDRMSIDVPNMPSKLGFPVAMK